ncbi:MAG: acylphosphatase [Candidatus Woesearchaeota archaeon]|jgi:acylphosphatase|nr:acylphosphatase [Candidatus Woesearchaeota archaeon]MDP7610744.1 acylphosphatase [Candidatus Woesearchaeota archaeon]|tara:strand:+ start:136 stop:411 length:276 start_codon:yes stop_codon:yes gene_type:complete
MKKRLHLIIHGTVQGVFFRDFTKQQAKSLNITGYVKNQTGNSVELVAEGEEESLNQLLQLCKQGPSSAEVTNLNIKWEEYKNEFKEFSITY